MNPTYYGEEAALLRHFGPVHVGSVIVDIGAYHPTWKSNSYYFEQQGWQAICIEANKHCIPGLRAQRKRVYHYGVADRNQDLMNFYDETTLAIPHRQEINTLHKWWYFAARRKIDMDFLRIMLKQPLSPEIAKEIQDYRWKLGSKLLYNM